MGVTSVKQSVNRKVNIPVGDIGENAWSLGFSGPKEPGSELL